jgi:hypothetical protein
MIRNTKPRMIDDDAKPAERQARWWCTVEEGGGVPRPGGAKTNAIDGAMADALDGA